MRRECRGAVGSGWCSVCYLTIGYGFRGSSRKYTNLSGGMKSDAFLFYSEVRKCCRLSETAVCVYAFVCGGKSVCNVTGKFRILESEFRQGIDFACPGINF